NKSKELLGLVGLSDRLEHKPSALSGGEQQRVAVARALVNNPKIIFADEPSGNLDTQNSDALHQLINRLNKEFNQTFVIVTHNNELMKLANRVFEIRDGKICGLNS
ncbi:MAG: ATP-binding cassette domain-containing protein, partial [Bacteroidetes bacterium]|nr:ATP-binding cassette domain-containing protein [Bacteroidota bacterium]